VTEWVTRAWGRPRVPRYRVKDSVLVSSYLSRASSCSKMCAVSMQPGASSPTRPGLSTLVSAAVAIAVVAGWLAYVTRVYPHVEQRVSDVKGLQSHWYLFSLIDVMVRYFAPYALVLLLWGRTGRRRLGAAACAVLTGLYMWGIWVIFDKWVWGDNATPAQVTAYVWASLLVISTGIAVAWGIARRWGQLWMVGLVVAPALAAMTHELAIHSVWWRTHLLFDKQGSHDLTSQMVFIAPAAITAVVCWLIDLGTHPRPSGPVPEPAAQMAGDVG
jgi:hypothetical protein